MGSVIATQVDRLSTLEIQNKILSHLKISGQDFPGFRFHPPDGKNWMNTPIPENLQIYKIIWPGTHDSATDKIGIPFISRPFAQCQTLSVYEQLVMGTRVLHIRVQEDYNVCHGILITHVIEVVMEEVKKILLETESEFIILEVRTEHGHEDPPGFDKSLEDELGELLIHQDDNVFEKTIAEVLPRRIICVWNTRRMNQPEAGRALWGGEYLKDDWINTVINL